jgi:hypothetical protein
MSHDQAHVRTVLQRIPQVSRTWFEIESDGVGPRTTTLVVEVTFDLDPNSIHYPEQVLDAIEETAKSVSGGMGFSKVRIISRT